MQFARIACVAKLVRTFKNKYWTQIAQINTDTKTKISAYAAFMLLLPK